jgi:hypothetical protein
MRKLREGIPYIIMEENRIKYEHIITDKDGTKETKKIEKNE